MAVTVTPDSLAKSAIQFRKELLMVITIALQNSLQHMTLRPGVQYKQAVGNMRGNAEFGPYDPERKNGAPDIFGRELEVYLGSVITEFDPNDVLSSIYGSLQLSGEALKGVDFSKLVLTSELISLSTKLNMALFGAVRNPAGTKSIDLFNGFDTIAKNDITAGLIATGNGNLHNFTAAIDNTNAVDFLKAFYRSATPELREKPVKLLMPYAHYDAYCDDYQQTVGAAAYNTAFGKTVLEGSNGLCELVPLASKKDATMLQLTSKTNMLVGTGSGNDLEKLSVDRFSAFKVTLSSAILFGCQYDSIQPEDLLIGKLFTV